MTDEKYDVESLSQDDLVSGEDTLVVRSRRPWGLLIAGLLFLALWVWRELGIRVARESATSQQAEISRLATENETLTQELQRVKREHAALSSGVTREIELRGQGSTPSASGRILFEPTTRRAVVFVYQLPRNPYNKSYQLWMSGANRRHTISGAVFDVTRRGSAAVVVTNVPALEPIEYTVTLQARGGDQAPAGNVYLRGTTTTP